MSTYSFQDEIRDTTNFKCPVQYGRYVDKTPFLQCVHSRHRYMICRPKHFGTSLLANVIDIFYRLKVDRLGAAADAREQKALFEDLVIAETGEMKYCGRFPVVHTSFHAVQNGKLTHDVRKVMTEMYRIQDCCARTKSNTNEVR